MSTHTDVHICTHALIHVRLRPRLYQSSVTTPQVSTLTCTSEHTHTRTNATTHTHARARIHAHTHTHTRTCVHMHAHTYTQARAHTRVHTHMRTHARTHGGATHANRRSAFNSLRAQQRRPQWHKPPPATRMTMMTTTWTHRQLSRWSKC